MTSEIRFYRDGDEDGMPLRPDMAANFDAIGGQLYGSDGWAGSRFTLVDGGRPLAIGGLIFDESSDSWDAWLLVGPLRPRHWLQIYQRARDVMATARAATPARIWVQADECRGAVSFITRLGFRPSGEKGVYYV